MAGREEPSAGIGAHLKRYGVFYGIAAVIVVALVALPAVSGDDDDEPEVAADDRSDAPATDNEGPWGPASGDIQTGTGTTRLGDECTPGALQVPAIEYSAPCLPTFEGDNGGATSKGVTADTIKIVLRDFPSSANEQQTQAEIERAGFATEELRLEIRDQFLEYLNGAYELYGRKVEFIDYESRFGNQTQEAIGAGREGACQDATFIAEEIGAFGVVGDEAGVSGVFAECAAERGLLVFSGGAYYSEDWYRKWSPYVYSTTMSCDRVSAHLAEYIRKRMADRPALYAGGDLQGQDRKFGTYVPDNEEYVKCTEVTRERLEGEGYDRGLLVTYALDISRFADQANRAILQFKAEGVTTIVAACDPISLGMLTNAAADQDYYPEWLIIGSAAQDSDNFGRSYNQEVVSGRMFGLSQLASSELIYGPGSDAHELYEEITGEVIPNGTTGALYTLATHVFNMLQAAGPDLTPENVERGVQSLPVLGGPDFAVGKRWFGEGVDGKPDHTATDDEREVYWDPDAEPGPEEPDRTKTGRFVETEPGVRYDLGEWPEGDPQIPGAG
jgi:hypothetical protein